MLDLLHAYVTNAAPLGAVMVMPLAAIGALVLATVAGRWL